MLTAAATLLLSAVAWYALGRRLCRCDSGGDAQGRCDLAFVAVFLVPAAFFGGVGLLLALLGLACPCRGADAPPAAVAGTGLRATAAGTNNVSARAGAALAAARRQDARLRDATKTPPAAPPCACGGACRCERGTKGCGCAEGRRPRTLPADDGGPDWTYDPARKGYYRTVPAAPAPAAPAPAFPAPAFAPPASFRPPPMMGGRMGGGACRGGG